jgi:hypothetical protein
MGVDRRYFVAAEARVLVSSPGVIISRVLAVKRTPAPKTRAGKLEVFVDFVFEEGVLFVSLSNVGERPARKVSVAFDQTFCGADGMDVASLPLFKNVEFLAPHKTITTLLDSSAAYFARGEPTRITASVS